MVGGGGDEDAGDGQRNAPGGRRSRRWLSLRTSRRQSVGRLPKRPSRLRAKWCLKPMKLKVSRRPAPRCSRSLVARLPNPIRRVFFSWTTSLNFARRSLSWANIRDREPHRSRFRGSLPHLAQPPSTFGTSRRRDARQDSVPALLATALTRWDSHPSFIISFS